MEHNVNLPTERPEDCSELTAIACRGIAFPHQRIPIEELIADFDLHAQSDCHECAVIAAWDALHQDGEGEPECSCQTAGADLFDPRGCEVHDSTSRWNGQQGPLRLGVR